MLPFRAGAIAAACTVIFLMYLNLQSVTVLNLNPGMEDPQRVLIWAAFHVMPKLVGHDCLPALWQQDYLLHPHSCRSLDFLLHRILFLWNLKVKSSSYLSAE